MGDAYKQRVGHFIKKMIQHPIKLPDQIKNEGVEIDLEDSPAKVQSTITSKRNHMRYNSNFVKNLYRMESVEAKGAPGFGINTIDPQMSLT